MSISSDFVHVIWYAIFFHGLESDHGQGGRAKYTGTQKDWTNSRCRYHLHGVPWMFILK